MISWQGWYAAVGGRFALLVACVAVSVVAAWLEYGRCWDAGRVAAERPGVLLPGWEVVGEP